MEQISQLMDGEIEGQESSLLIRRLGKDPQMVQAWDTYHLIRDVLRNEAGASFGVAQRVHEDLKAEPAILAPRTRLVARLSRESLPMAAAVAGVAVVGWLALVNQPQLDDSAQVATGSQPSIERTLAPAVSNGMPSLPAEEPIAEGPQRIPTVLANGQFNDYLVAHQEFSPSTTFQGGAPYTRTLPYEDPGNAQ